MLQGWLSTIGSDVRLGGIRCLHSDTTPPHHPPHHHPLLTGLFCCTSWCPMQLHPPVYASLSIDDHDAAPIKPRKTS